MVHRELQEKNKKYALKYNFRNKKILILNCTRHLYRLRQTYLNEYFLRLTEYYKRGFIRKWTYNIEELEILKIPSKKQPIARNLNIRVFSLAVIKWFKKYYLILSDFKSYLFYFFIFFYIILSEFHKYRYLSSGKESLILI